MDVQALAVLFSAQLNIAILAVRIEIGGLVRDEIAVADDIAKLGQILLQAAQAAWKKGRSAAAFQASSSEYFGMPPPLFPALRSRA